MTATRTDCTLCEEQSKQTSIRPKQHIRKSRRSGTTQGIFPARNYEIHGTPLLQECSSLSVANHHFGILKT